ncbi:hypothetical protein EDD37DRAFT_649989 [Exophiala viscosa]|uniref:RING-type E3 ubiquitin transferase n=1 Tax=Exophiala viscosa TaxID=2486360 RepID=A0AAN6IEZ0_9EURO|nr:hypothetical protein EDD36DRAFT_171805 [Exophiala viscosa]KAI1624095.1 hypothetical protein EDD37DRAFT_649989 [Exophiala viscosa]
MHSFYDIGRWSSVAIASLSMLCWQTYAQTLTPSNDTSDLYSAATSPRFILNGTEFSSIKSVELAPLGVYAEMSHSSFLAVDVSGHLANVDASNANSITDESQFSYLSCDPSAYSGGNLDASDVFRVVVNSPRTSIVILYSETANHCTVSGLSQLPTIGGILTTTNPTTATKLAKLNLGTGSSGTANIFPDLDSYTNSTSGSFSGTALGSSPTTAVAMIILYSITGVITALFVVIIVTGAVRAHRHPERYGPRNVIGRGRQSRAKGIARAMLETLPIVKFGDHDDLPKKPAEGSDLEMNAANTETPATNDVEPTNKAVPGQLTTTDAAAQAGVAAHNPDGRDAEGHLGCSICTEDFNKGEEVRVLPCNHKFHPACVDPWLLNVSGTCPLCRIDLRPQDQEGDVEGAQRNDSSTPVPAGQAASLPPPLVGADTTDESGPRGGRRETIANLRHLAHGSREDRIAALRRFRQEGQRSNSPPRQSDEERSGLSRRFRERFRIRTERRGTAADQSAAQ